MKLEDINNIISIMYARRKKKIKQFFYLQNANKRSMHLLMKGFYPKDTW